jgi:hypothetical protein
MLTKATRDNTKCGDRLLLLGGSPYDLCSVTLFEIPESSYPYWFVKDYNGHVSQRSPSNLYKCSDELWEEALEVYTNFRGACEKLKNKTAELVAARDKGKQECHAFAERLYAMR